MLKVVETFSGIGSQSKALEKLGIKFEILAIVEWDINAIYAYDIIHHGKQNLSPYNNFDKTELIEKLMWYTLSSDGKKPINDRSLKMMSSDALRRILCAIERSKNLVNIVDVKGKSLPDEIDLLTYSFPCQDLSVCGAWHGNMSGIDRNANNRSGMLWEVERIIKERVELNMRLPRFLLMENVSNILSPTHKDNFKEWTDYLENIGYINKIYTLNATDFGIPQKRVRTYMLSVFSDDIYESELINKYLIDNDLEKSKSMKMRPLSDFLRTDYDSNTIYRDEADWAQRNDTPSRRKIFDENEILFDGEKTIKVKIKTLTTKQDRNPTSGLIVYDSGNVGKANYRNLTPRECFLLMGFEERDYQKLMDNNFKVNHSRDFLTREKLEKMAGNSIVVNVLESIFKQVDEINNSILCKTKLLVNL